MDRTAQSSTVHCLAAETVKELYAAELPPVPSEGISREEFAKIKAEIAENEMTMLALDRTEEGWIRSGDLGFQAFMDTVDVLVMGRNTYEMVLSTGLWPYGSTRVVVLSSTLSQISDKMPKTVKLKSGPLTEIAKELMESGAKHLWVDGGKTIQGFLNPGLIQEIIITIIPVLIGKGLPLFGPIDKDLKLQHLETRSFANGFVQSKYKVRE